MYKLIAIDLDGTLLTDNKRITKENLNVLKELMKKDYEIVIATGRRYWSAKRKVKDIDENLVILANNGNIVRRFKDDKALISRYMNVDDFHVLVQEGKKEGLHPIVHIDEYHEGCDMIIELDRDDSRYYDYLSDNLDRYKKVESFLKVKAPKVLTVVYVGKREKLESFRLNVIEKYPKKYNSHVMHNVTNGNGLLEIMNPVGTKWSSLEKYGKEKGILPEEIIAIGDDNNDIAMIKNAGLGVAMKNGTEMTKKAADIVTKKDNNKNGVAHILKEILKI